MNADTKMTIKELLERRPQATGVFIKRRMLCVGCPAESFHTLEDAAKLYGINLNDLVTAISRVVHKKGHPK